MKKLLIIGMVMLTIIAFMGCQDSGVTPVPEEPPVILPIPPTFDEVVIGKFWQVEGIERYQSTLPRAAATLPYEKDICMLWGEDTITAYEDLNGDGFMSPGEEVAVEPYALNLSTSEIAIGALVFTITGFDADGWNMTTYIDDGTTAPDWLGDVGDGWAGYVTIHYIPCEYPWLDESISYEFAFVMDDMGDTVADWDRICKWFRLDVDFDWADGFYYTSGTPADSYFGDDPVLGNHILVVDYHDGYGDDIDSLMVVYTEAYGPMVFDWPDQLKPDHVYDMAVEVFASDAATVGFVSRVDGSGFEKDVIMDFSEMGSLIIRGVDDCDVPIVNPAL